MDMPIDRANELIFLSYSSITFASFFLVDEMPIISFSAFFKSIVILTLDLFISDVIAVNPAASKRFSIFYLFFLIDLSI